MIKLFNKYPAPSEMEAVVNEIEEECKPFRPMLTTVELVEIYRVFFNRPNPPKGTWMETDIDGNIWVSSKKEGRHYDVIPHDDVEALLKEKSTLENYIGYIAINSKGFGNYLQVVSLPTDEEHNRVFSYTYLCEACGKLKASANRKTFIEVLHF